MPIAMQYGSGNYTAQNMPQSGGGGSSGGIEIKLLWTNPNPNALFNSQTISLDLSGYDAVGIIVNFYVQNPCFMLPMQILPCDSNYSHRITISQSLGNYTGGRQVDFLPTGLQIGAGYYNGAANNTACVPYQIYGIKGIT